MIRFPFKIAGHTMGTPEYTVYQAIELFSKIGADGIEIVIQDGYYSGLSCNVTHDELDKVKLKTGKILTAEKVKDANKLYKLTVDMGSETRTIVSGLVPYYNEDELIGKTVIVVSNLKPAKLKGIESNGMLLAAGENDNVKLLTVDGDVELGSIVC